MVGDLVRIRSRATKLRFPARRCRRCVGATSWSVLDWPQCTIDGMIVLLQSLQGGGQGGGEDVVRYQENEGIGRITLNRPGALNALNGDVLRRLASVLDEAGTDDAVGAVVITGSGEKAFSANADIKYINRATPLEVWELA